IMLDLHVAGELPGIIAREWDTEFVAKFGNGRHADRTVEVKVQIDFGQDLEVHFWNGFPSALGGRERPTKPASTRTVTTYGRIWMNWTGIDPTPCSRICTASEKPNSRQASAVGMGFHLPKMRAASAMKPRPAVMFREND